MYLQYKKLKFIHLHTPAFYLKYLHKYTYYINTLLLHKYTYTHFITPTNS